MNRLRNNYTFDSLQDGDNTGDVIGYICEIHHTNAVGQRNEYKCYKFILNSGLNQRLICLIWEDQLINRWSPTIELHKIVHITDGSIRSKLPVRDHFVPFSLTVQRHTSINFIGHYDQLSLFQHPPEPREVVLEDIMDANGIIRIRGYIKDQVVPVHNTYGNSTYGLGTITDGRFKIPVIVSEYAPINFQRTTPVIAEGHLGHDNPCKLICRDSTAIQRDDSRIQCSIATLLSGTV